MTRRLALLVNPSSGRRPVPSATVAAVGERLSAASFDVTVGQGADGAEAADLAKSFVEAGYDALVCMGGDGLAHLALQAVATSSTTLGIIPTGSGNDVARCLRLPRRDPLAAAGVICTGSTRALDCARVGNAYVATVVAAGFDSRVNERANAWSWPRGQLRYPLATIAELRVFHPVPFTVEVDGVRLHRDAMLVAVGNCPSYGGGLRICAGARVDDGLLDVVIINTMTKPDLIKTYPRLFRGSHVTHPAYEQHRVRRVSLAAPGIVAYGDGERLGPLPVTIEAVPGAVTVFAPPP